jgi:hypothetical protein
MAELRVEISWNEATEQWRMVDIDTGMFIQEFYDCDNMRKFFPGMEKGFKYGWAMPEPRLLHMIFKDKPNGG